MCVRVSLWKDKKYKRLCLKGACVLGTDLWDGCARSPDTVPYINAGGAAQHPRAVSSSFPLSLSRNKCTRSPSHSYPPCLKTGAPPRPLRAWQAVAVLQCLQRLASSPECMDVLLHLPGLAPRLWAALTCGSEPVAAEVAGLFGRLWAPHAARRGAGVCLGGGGGWAWHRFISLGAYRDCQHWAPRTAPRLAHRGLRSHAKPRAQEQRRRAWRRAIDPGWAHPARAACAHHACCHQVVSAAEQLTPAHVLVC